MFEIESNALVKKQPTAGFRSTFNAIGRNIFLDWGRWRRWTNYGAWSSRDFYFFFFYDKCTCEFRREKKSNYSRLSVERARGTDFRVYIMPSEHFPTRNYRPIRQSLIKNYCGTTIIYVRICSRTDKKQRYYRNARVFRLHFQHEALKAVNIGLSDVRPDDSDFWYYWR